MINNVKMYHSHKPSTVCITPKLTQNIITNKLLKYSLSTLHDGSEVTTDDDNPRGAAQVHYRSTINFELICTFDNNEVKLFDVKPLFEKMICGSGDIWGK